MSESIRSTCLNCDSPLFAQERYCSNCGQKKRQERATISELLSDAFSSITNWDNAFWQTLKVIFIPGKLTQEYFRGRRKNYIPPVRLFLVSAVFLFAALNMNYGDFLTISLTDDKDLKTLFEEVVYHDFYENKLDSIAQGVKVVYPTEDAQLAIDSTLRAFEVLIFRDSIEANDNVISNFEIENAEGKKVNFTISDLKQTPEEFIAKNKIEGFWKETFVRQLMRFAKNPDSLLQFVMGQLTWMCLFMMPVLALFLKLLYWRRKRYYVEHLVFAFHLQSVIFLLLILMILVVPQHLDGVGGGVIFLTLITYIYSLLAFYRFYQQGWLKTWVKNGLLFLFYLFLFSFSFMMTLLLSAFLF